MTGSKYACKKVCVNMYVLCNDTFIYEKQGKSTRFDSEPYHYGIKGTAQ